LVIPLRRIDATQHFLSARQKTPIRPLFAKSIAPVENVLDVGQEPQISTAAIKPVSIDMIYFESIPLS
jgi:hypothetical protein